MVFYRKYRPQTISELDNAKLRETLYSILTQKDSAHAFLFTGPKGLGKTSTARIIAKVLNCESPIVGNGTIEPCNTCDQCISITNGSNIDVLEIDGASNRGIDEIRDLREKVRLAPSRSTRKVYIIDEVHMLTTEAFNALLKTIEEPPAHVVFIFATTEPQKVPATILSRCFHVSLAPATQEELLRAFNRIVQGESIDIEKDALEEIARLSDGGFRDGTKLLEETVLLAHGKKITKAFVETTNHVSNLSEQVSKFVSSLAHHDGKVGLQIIAQLITQGSDVRFFLAQVIEKLHSMFLISAGVGTGEPLPKGLTSADIQFLTTLFAKAYQDMKYAVIPQLPLEMVIVTWADMKAAVPVEAVSFVSASGKPTIAALIKKQKNIQVQAILNQEEVEVVVAKPVTHHKQHELKEDVDTHKTLMENIIYVIQPKNNSLAAVLRGCAVLAIEDTSVTFQTAYKFHKERLEDPKARDLLEKSVKELLGKPVNVHVVLKGGEKHV